MTSNPSLSPFVVLLAALLSACGGNDDARAGGSGTGGTSTGGAATGGTSTGGAATGGAGTGGIATGGSGGSAANSGGSGGASIPICDAADPATCATPAGDFVCGSFYCDLKTQYCRGTLNLESCAEDYACAPIPNACAAAPTCDCIVKEDALISCTGEAASGLTGDLPGGNSPNCP